MSSTNATVKTTNKSSGYSLSASSSSKYDGLIEIPIHKRMRSAMTNLFTFFDNFAPRMPEVHAVITFFRFAQFLGPALLVHLRSLWPENSITHDVVSILSIVWHWCPPELRSDASLTLLFSYSGLCIVIAILNTVSAFYYRKTAQLPTVLCYITNFVICTACFIVHPVAVQFLAELFGELISGKRSPAFVPILAIIMAALCISYYIWFMTNVFSFTILFRPCSFMTAEPRMQKVMMVMTSLVTLLTTFCLYLSKWIIFTSLIIVACLYFYSIRELLYGASVIKLTHQKVFLACSLTGGIYVLIGMFYIALGKQYPDLILFIFLALFVLNLIIAHFVITKVQYMNLALLDTFEAEREVLIFKTPAKVSNVAITGFSFNHPACISFALFKEASQTFVSSSQTWSIFAKFAAIYPENQSLLQFISKSIINEKIKGQAKSIVFQIMILNKSREMNLSPDLKNKIGKITREINKAKHKLRNIWDLILQGNITDMDMAVDAADESVKRASFEISHILMQYPNNRFVARLYARYLNEVIADHISAKKWRDNSNLLQRGISVNLDTAHELGMAAFPNIPGFLQNEVMPTQATGLDMDASEDFTAEDESVTDNSTLISHLIEEHQVSGVRIAKISISLLYILLIFVPLIGLFCYFFSFLEELRTPLDHLYGTAYLRHLTSMMSSFTARYLMETIDHPSRPGKLAPAIDLDGLSLSSMCHGLTIKEQMECMLKEVIQSSELLGPLRSFNVGNKNMDKARQLLFDKNVHYTYMLSITSNITEHLSADIVCTRIASHISKLLESPTLTRTDLFSTNALTPLNNYVEPAVWMSLAMEETILYIRQNDLFNQEMFLYLVIGYCAFLIIASVITYICTFKKMGSDKHRVYKCLTYLPKTVISNVSASFYTIKKNGHGTSSSVESDSDINKQEENIIKVFTTISDGGSNSNTSLISLFAYIFVAGLGCGAAVTLCLGYQNISTMMVNSAPHVDYLLGTTSTMNRAFASLYKIILCKNGFEELLSETKTDYKIVTDALYKMIDFFQSARYGGTGKNEFAYSGIQDAIAEAGKFVICHNKSKSPTDIDGNANCFGSGLRLYLFQALFFKILSPIESDMYPPPDDPLMTSTWKMGPLLMYDTFFSPMATKIVTTISNDFDTVVNPMIIGVVILLIASFCAMLVIIYEAEMVQQKLKFAFRLLLHCPPQTILTSQKLLVLLGGNYKNEVDDTTERNADFFNDVVNKLTDLVVVIRKDDNIIYATNSAFNALFKVEQDQMAGLNVIDFFKSKFGETDFNILKGVTNLVYINDNERMDIQWSSSTIGSNVIISGRDISIQVKHEQLIADERKKSDQMLSSILPPSLVPRVQEGEKEISFAVQSISVLFLDIVEFTPWCGSNTAQYVMKTLNTIFKEMDALVGTHKTLTRVKCIGDCYMAAGGIFDEVNQPAVHSRETVEFGCEAIKKIGEINEMLNEKLRIRVGINTGGPIVAGVLGTDKPTFEILGPTINIAQQMEHHGIPMMVHISRPVYELIYGGAFEIKERGEIEVKKGKMFTYLVSP